MSLDELAAELQRDVLWIAGPAIGQRHLWNGKAPKLLETAARIVAEFQAAGYTEIQRQAYMVPRAVFANLDRDYDVENIAVEIPGTAEPEKIVVVGAHYDTFPLDKWDDEREPLPGELGTPGANDNGSGVAAVLALARYYRRTGPLKRTLRFVAFANEEPPFFRTSYMGSKVYARACHERSEQIVLMITPETIGCYRDKPEPKDAFQAFLMRLLTGFPGDARHILFLSDCRSRRAMKEAARAFSGRVATPVRTAAAARVVRHAVRWPLLGRLFASGYERRALPYSRGCPLGVPTERWSDDSAFWEFGYPAFALTDSAYLRYKHYHELSDTPDKLDYPTMATVVEGMKAIVERFADDS